ncbi:MAG: hypothetical protein ACFFF4_08020 [Candidatus Thorarchaeota archaeon]
MEEHRDSDSRNVFLRNCIIMIIALVLVPFTYGISFLVLWFALLFWILSKNMQRRREFRIETLDRAQEIARTYESDSEEGIYLSGTEDQYQFPKKCPYCGAVLKLDKVQWVDSVTALCPNCESAIQAS